MPSETFQSSASSSSNDVRPDGAYPKVQSYQHPPQYATYCNQHPYDAAPQMLNGFQMGQDKLYIDAIVRIARLEKELEQCKLSKGEAEIGLLRLVHLMPGSLRDGPSDNSQSLGALQHQLAQANHHVETLSQQLKQANSLILTLSQTIASLSQSRSTTAGKSKTSSDEYYDSNSSTLFHESDADEEGENHSKSGNAWPSASVSLPLETGPATSAYIRRFGKGKDISDANDKRQASRTVESSEPSSLSSSFSSSSDNNVSKGKVAESYVRQIVGIGAQNANSTFESNAANFPSSCESNTRENKVAKSASKEVVHVKPRDWRDESATAQFATTNAIINCMDIQWHISNEWSTFNERNNTVHIHQVNASVSDLRFPDLFRYGLRFTPQDDEMDVYRTVAITKLPQGISLTELLSKVRGGKVFDAKLLNTVPITGTVTAMIIFVKQYAAIEYADFVKKHPIRFEDHEARIGIIPTPTWPISHTTNNFVLQHEISRCFEVHNFPRTVTPAELKKELAVTPGMKWTAVEHMSLHGGVLSLRFNAIKFAKQAYGLFCGGRYRGRTVKWTADPCDQPPKSLLEPVELREVPEAVNHQEPTPFTITDPQFSVSKLLGLGAVGDEEESTARLEKVDVGDEAAVRKGRGFNANSGDLNAESINASTASSFCTIS